MGWWAAANRISFVTRRIPSRAHWTEIRPRPAHLKLDHRPFTRGSSRHNPCHPQSKPPWVPPPEALAAAKVRRSWRDPLESPTVYIVSVRPGEICQAAGTPTISNHAHRAPPASPRRHLSHSPADMSTPQHPEQPSEPTSAAPGSPEPAPAPATVSEASPADTSAAAGAPAAEAAEPGQPDTEAADASETAEGGLLPPGYWAQLAEVRDVQARRRV